MRICPFVWIIIAASLTCIAQTTSGIQQSDGVLLEEESDTITSDRFTSPSIQKEEGELVADKGDTIKSVPFSKLVADSIKKQGMRISLCAGFSRFPYRWLQIGYFDLFAKPYGIFNNGLGNSFSGDIKIMLLSDVKFCPFISLALSMGSVSENSNFTFYDLAALDNDTIVSDEAKFKRSLTISQAGIGAGVSIELGSFRSFHISVDPDVLFLYGWDSFFADKKCTFRFHKDKVYPYEDSTADKILHDYCVGVCFRLSPSMSFALSKKTALLLQGCFGIQWTNVMRNGKDGIWKIIGTDGKEREIRLNSLLAGMNFGVRFAL
jgi:hypothetical protein